MALGIETIRVMEHWVAGHDVSADFYGFEHIPLVGSTDVERVACARLRAEYTTPPLQQPQPPQPRGQSVFWMRAH